MKTQIKKRVLSLVSQYHTQDPVELAESLNILVLFEDLGQIGGYYNTAYRQKMIHINDRLSDPMRKFTAAHELGHALLHSHMNTPFLRTNTCFSVYQYTIQQEPRCRNSIRWRGSLTSIGFIFHPLPNQKKPGFLQTKKRRFALC